MLFLFFTKSLFLLSTIFLFLRLSLMFCTAMEYNK
jgi:hypothetical protein